jgi:hypothetical protein
MRIKTNTKVNVLMIIVVLGLFLAINPLNLRPVNHDSIYGTAVKKAVEQVTGEPYEVVVSWVKENLKIEEYCMNFQDVKGSPISDAELKNGAPFIVHYVHDDTWKEDCNVQQTGHKLKFVFKFPKPLPSFLEKGFSSIDKSCIGLDVNSILHFLPIEPVKLSVKNTRSGELADIRYLSCHLDAMNEDKTEFTIVTEPFALCDNPLFAGRIAGINRVYFPQEEKCVMTISGTYFERIHK